MSQPRTDPPVLGVGELLWDELPDGRQIGGAPANFAYHVHALGLAAYPVSAVGDDPDGDDLLQALRRHHVDTRLVSRRTDRPTGRVGVELEGGKPTYTIHSDTAWDGFEVTTAVRDLAGSAAAVCFGSLAQRTRAGRKTVAAVLDATPDGCLRVFDVNLRPPFIDADVVTDGLRRANVFKLSDEEVPQVADLVGLPNDPDDFCRQAIMRFDLKLLVLTCGGDGSRLVTPDGDDRHNGVDVDVVSTVGAGDSFTAAVVAGLLRGMPLHEIHDHAVRLAGYVCTQPGAMPTLPEELLRA